MGPTPGLSATLPPTPMVPTGISARGLLRLRLSLRLMLMLTTAPLATTVRDTPTTDSTDTMDTAPTLPLPTPGLLATPPLTPMVPTGISARGLLMLRLSLRPMLMLTTAPLATTVWDTPTTDSTDTTDTGPTLPLPTPGLLATPPPTPMVPTGISARGLLRLRLRLRLSLRLMLMLTTAPLATTVWDTPTMDSTDTTDTGPTLPLPTPGLSATL